MFHDCRICGTNFGEGSRFAPPHPWAAPKKPILNGVYDLVVLGDKLSCEAFERGIGKGNKVCKIIKEQTKATLLSKKFVIHQTTTEKLLNKCWRNEKRRTCPNCKERNVVPSNWKNLRFLIQWKGMKRKKFLF